MNERVLELARQVWPDPNISHVNHMKFAELIVRECSDLVKDFYQEDEFTCYSAAEEIKEHFGVEL